MILHNYSMNPKKFYSSNKPSSFNIQGNNYPPGNINIYNNTINNSYNIVDSNKKLPLSEQRSPTINYDDEIERMNENRRILSTGGKEEIYKEEEDNYFINNNPNKMQDAQKLKTYDKSNAIFNNLNGNRKQNYPSNNSDFLKNYHVNNFSNYMKLELGKHHSSSPYDSNLHHNNLYSNNIKNTFMNMKAFKNLNHHHNTEDKFLKALDIKTEKNYLHNMKIKHLLDTKTKKQSFVRNNHYNIGNLEDDYFHNKERFGLLDEMKLNSRERTLTKKLTLTSKNLKDKKLRHQLDYISTALNKKSKFKSRSKTQKRTGNLEIKKKENIDSYSKENENENNANPNLNPNPNNNIVINHSNTNKNNLAIRTINDVGVEDEQYENENQISLENEDEQKLITEKFSDKIFDMKNLELKKYSIGKISREIFSRSINKLNNYEETKTLEYLDTQLLINSYLQLVIVIASLLNVYIEYEINYTNFTIQWQPNSGLTFSEFYKNENIKLSYQGITCLWISFLLSIILWVLVYMEIVIKNKITEIQYDLPMNLFLRKNQKLFSIIFYCLIVIPHPNPIFIGLYFTNHNRIYNVYLVNSINSVMSIICLLRLWIPFKCFLMNSSFFSRRTKRVAEMNGVKSGLFFTLKANLQMNPYQVYLCILVCIMLFSTFSMRVFERELDHLTGRVFADYWSSAWCFVITVLTVGYGDFFPSTDVGRLVAVVSCFI